MCVLPTVVRGTVALVAMASMFASPAQIILAADETSSSVKSEHFDRDPGWEGFNNRNMPKDARMVEQNFGYSKTQFASKSPGEAGGSIQRTSTAASYAAPLSPARTLDDKLTASGTFAAFPGKGSGGVVFGFFSSQQPGGKVDAP